MARLGGRRRQQRHAEQDPGGGAEREQKAGVEDDDGRCGNGEEGGHGQHVERLRAMIERACGKDQDRDGDGADHGRGAAGDGAIEQQERGGDDRCRTAPARSISRQHAASTNASTAMLPPEMAITW